jgi:hypothetical protein
MQPLTRSLLQNAASLWETIVVTLRLPNTRLHAGDECHLPLI